MPRKAQSKIYYLSPDEAARVLAAGEEIGKRASHYFTSYDAFVYPYIVLALYTGCRPGEALSLKWDAVDFQNKLIHFEARKTGTVRVIAMTTQVYDALTWWKEWFWEAEKLAEHEKRTFDRQAGREDAHARLEKLARIRAAGYVFPSLRALGKKPDLRKQLKNLFIKALGHKETPYVTRHTFATTLVLSGVPETVTQHLLGHSSIATTNIYTRLKQTHEQVAISTLENAYKEKLSQNCRTAPINTHPRKR